MKNSFNVLDSLKLDVQVTSNPFNFQLNQVFEVGARENPKRSFLFINKLLGKHLAVHPDIPQITGHLLANLFVKAYQGTYFSDTNFLVRAIQEPSILDNLHYYLDHPYILDNKTLFIGFAETATGLAHAVFSAFTQAYFAHTTREEFADRKSVFSFTEDHSHAVNHSCFLEDDSLLRDVKHIVLIDDEITTGNTCLHLIRALNQRYSGKQYTVLSLMDWRNPEDEQRYTEAQDELGVSIKNLSLIRGRLDQFTYPTFHNDQKLKEGSAMYQVLRLEDFLPKVNVKLMHGKYQGFLRQTGRFGMHSDEGEGLETVCRYYAEFLNKYFSRGEKTLCIGTGEFIYIPSRIASYLGRGVEYKSSTRSPIYIADADQYPVHNRISYVNDDGVINYIYNLKDRGYDEVFMFFEKEPSGKLLRRIAYQLKSQDIQKYYFILM